MIQSTVVLLGFVRHGSERETVPLLVEQSAAFDGLKRKSSFRVVGGYFHLLHHWCIMVFYEGYVVGDPVMEALREHLAAFCLDGRTYEHVEPIAEPFFSETGANNPFGAWKWETRICYLEGSIYRLKWDDAVHVENTKQYAAAIEKLFEMGAWAGTD